MEMEKQTGNGGKLMDTAHGIYILVSNMGCIFKRVEKVLAVKRLSQLLLAFLPLLFGSIGWLWQFFEIRV